MALVGTCCPTCNGSGVVDPGTDREKKPTLEAMAEYMEACAQVARNAAGIYPKDERHQYNARMTTAIAEFLRTAAGNKDAD